MLQIIDAVKDERYKQIKNGMEDFDKNNSKNDWVGYITAYSGRAVDKAFVNSGEKRSFEDCMIKIAALAIAAIQSSQKGNC